MFWGS